MKQRLDKSNVAQILPLTSLQNGMLFHYLEQPDSLQYVEQLTITLQGTLDLEAITKAWEHVSRTNEVLRAVFRWEKLDKPVMIVLKEKALPILFKDLSEATDPAQSLQAFTYEDQQQGIDLLEDPIRITICKLSEEVFAMVVTNHHMLYDGWSNGILMKEFIEAYNCCIEAKPFPSCSKNSFGQFAQWHKAYQENEPLSYWEKYLEGLESRTVFPPKRKANASIRPSRYKCVIEDDLAQAIDAFNKERKLTLSTLLYTAWGIVLGKYSYDWDVLFGTTVSGRNVKVRGIEEMVGLFINTLPVRVQLQPEMLISEQLKEVQQQLVAREDHEQSTLADIQSKVKGVVGEDLFRTLLVVENYPMEQEIEKLSRHLKVRGVDTFEMTHYALTVVVECLQNLSISFLYDDENLTEAQIKRLGRHMVNVIRAIISAPDQKVSELTMLDADETEALKAFNPPATPYEAEKTLPQIFEEQVAQREEAIAVQYGEVSLSYKALNERANQLAHFLTKEGVNVQTPVGLLCERSVEMIVAIWGVLKAGGTYVPIDPEYPKTRIDDIVEDSGLKFMLTHCQKEAMQFEGCMTIELTALEGQLQKEPTHNPVNRASADDLAYIMYTSGSTGKPKGTLISHANISRVVRYTNYITIQKEDTLLQLSNYSFDGSTFDLFGAFLNGAKLVLVGSHQLLDAVALGQLIQEEQVTVFFITTALFNNLMDEIPEALKHVRCVLTGGERMSTEHAKKFYKLYGGGKLMNVYGPTESTVFATCHKLEDLAEETEAIPIGKPIANTTIYILDKSGKLAPLGAVGELCIGGQGIGKGYLNNEALTQEKFISNPFDASGKLYRTGDLAKWNEQGEVNYEERIDQQIKLRGYRIELGEIEKALSKVEDLKQGVVQVIGDATNERYICGYVVGEGEVSSIKAQLKAYLPYYMIPQQFVFMEQLPLNKNGKVDKKALPLPELQTQETVYVPPSNETETKLQAIWQEVLAYKPIGVNDFFYEVGGHSLKATRIVAKIHKAFDVQVPLATFFECMTIQALADYIDHAACESYEPIKAVATQEDYPLATAQRTVFLQEQFEGIGTSYHIPIALQVKKQLDFGRIQWAFQELIHSHEVLRTAFVMKEQPVQKILPDVPVNVERVVCNPDEVQSVLKQFVRRFDLAKPPLMRMLYIEVSGASNILAMDCHHMIADGIAITHLVEDFFKLYQKKTVAIPSIQYKDYVLWQAQELESEGMAKQKAFWQKMYESGIPTVDFVTDYPRKSQPSFEGGHQVFKLAAPLVEKLESVCKVHHVTMNAVLFAAYGLLLQKYAREETMVIGSLVAGRTHPDVEDMVGMFNNYLPILMEVPTSERCDTYLKKVNQQLSKCYAHQGYPYDLMIQDLQVRQSASRNPFFDTMLIYHNQLEKGQLDEVEGIGVEMLELENTTAKLDFKVDIYHSHDEMNCIFEYATALYKPSTIARMGSHYIKLLEEMVQRTSDTLGAITMLTEEEAFMLLDTFNDTQVPYSTEKTLVHMFEEQVQKTPTRIAVSYEDEQLTFEALGEKVHKLACYLRDSGVEDEQIVGVCMERSLEMIIAILAILKAGGTYMPMSPEYPEERITYMMQDSGAKLILCQERFQRQREGIRCINVEDESLYKGSGQALNKVYRPSQLAYVIYTSGSTGQPKGVMIEHGSVINRIQWMQKKYPIGEADCILQKTPYTFDVSVWELFWWLFTGARVHFLKPQGEKDPSEILQAIQKHHITTMHFVPSMLAVFLEYYETSQEKYDLSSLRQVFASGEALTVAQVKKFNQLIHRPYHTTLHNLYGPTEATVDVSYYDCPVEGAIRKIPIGKPIDNTRLYVLDEAKRLQPIGVPGELYISGVGVGRGYLNKPALTEEKFMEDPHYAGYRMYRSGDLTRWMEDGNIEYLGRMDHQVKLRGLRIELGEIEVLMDAYEGVLESVVVVKEDARGNQHLCGYYTANKTIEVSALRNHISQKLPHYMIPSFFVQLESMPLSANGKLDRKRLPEVDFKSALNETYVEPTTAIEKELAAIWLKLLNVDQVGVTHQFFELGGHSLIAAKLTAEIQSAFGIQMTLNKVFEKPTIKEQALYIEEAARHMQEKIVKADKRPYYPLAQAQERLYILNQIEPGTTYNLPCVLKIDGDLDKERLKSTIHTLVQQYDQLRASFHLEEGNPVQVVHDEGVIRLDEVKCAEEEVAISIEQFIQPFNLEEPSQVRFMLIQTSEHRHYFAFDMHHIIADGMSSVLLAKAFMDLYKGAEIERPQFEYVDYVLWQQTQSERMKDQEKFWIETLAAPLPTLDMQTDYQRPGTQRYEGRKLSFKINKALREAVKGEARKYGLTPYMYCVAAYNILLHKYTGQEDFLVGTPVAGRERTEFETMIGMFVNTVVLRNQPEGKKDVATFLQEVKKHTLDAFDHQAYPFEKLIQVLNVKRDLSRNPLFDTMFSYQNMGMPELTTEGLKFTSYPIENKVSKFDLTFEMVEEQEGWTLNIEYATSLFKATTIERMAKHYQLLLEKMMSDSTCAIETYEIVTEEEKYFIHQVFNATEVPYSDEVTLHEVFERQVQKTPHKVAARFGDSSITYEVLDQKATNLAKVLRRKGIGKNHIVGLMVERSLEMIIGIMGILKAGGAYMPISPDYPSERIAYMIADSKAKVVLTQQRFEGCIEDSEAMNLEDEALYTPSEEPLVPINDPRQLAYVIFTSGSTGQPKGVMIEHTSAINRIEWMQKYYPLKEDDTILQKTPFTFDVSVWELFWWMFTGSDVYFLEPQGEKDPQGMLKVIQREKITTMHFVPSMLSVFMEYYEMFQEKHDVTSLKKVFASGEALTPAQVQSFNRLFAPQGTGLYNLYGPTEATVDVSYFNCPSTGDITRVPIGKPIDNTRLYVLDNQKRIQPIGVAGELYISGIGVGRGYLNKEGLTHEKFMDDPYFEGYRMYRSGDLVKLAEDGEIDYLGRMDHQVKLRGLRIELGEIESAIAAYPAIVESAVLLREDGKGEKYLCGYYTAKAQVVIEELKYHLGQKLPEYMVPSFFVEMDYMPLSANGKLDRKALPEPERNLGDKTNYVAAQNTLQQQLITLWESLLEHDNIGIYDNFFDLGGHSLLLVKMHGELEKAYPGMLRITDLFEHTSIDKLASYIEHLQRKENLSRVLTGVKVQESYLTHQVGHEMSDIETFTFQEPLYHQLSELAISLSVQVEDVMRAAYLVYITQLSEDEKASIEINQGDGMNTVTIQMQDYATFEELIQWVATATRDTKSMYTYEEAKRSLEDQCIIFAYLSGETERAEREWLQKYDVIFSSTEKGGCRMAYNSSKLRSEAMRGFIDTYLRVLIYVLGEIEGVQYTNERV